MKTKLVFFPAAILALSAICFAQSVTITPKKTVYVRKGRDIEKHRRTFEIRYPVVSGSITPAAKRKLGNTISYWRTFETTLKESMESSYLSSLDYKVNYNKNGILDISLTSETMAAYPDTGKVNLVVDLKTGKAATFNDVFAANSRAKLAGLVDRKLAAEKKEIIKSIDADKESYTDTENKDSAKQSVADLKFTPESFNEFSVNDKGVTILYDAGFPHVIQALQPEGRYFFTWAQMKPFIRRDGLLGKFIR